MVKGRTTTTVKTLGYLYESESQCFLCTKIRHMSTNGGLSPSCKEHLKDLFSKEYKFESDISSGGVDKHGDVYVPETIGYRIIRTITTEEAE